MLAQIAVGETSGAVQQFTTAPKVICEFANYSQVYK